MTTKTNPNPATPTPPAESPGDEAVLPLKPSEDHEGLPGYYRSPGSPLPKRPTRPTDTD